MELYVFSDRGVPDPVRRVSHLWPALVSFENLLRASRNARRGKRFWPNVAAFEYRLEPELLSLQEDLETGRYRPGAYRTFKVYEPKERLISAAPYRDRVVHHALLNVIEPGMPGRLQERTTPVSRASVASSGIRVGGRTQKKCLRLRRATPPGVVSSGRGHHSRSLDEDHPARRLARFHSEDLEAAGDHGADAGHPLGPGVFLERSVLVLDHGLPQQLLRHVLGNLLGSTAESLHSEVVDVEELSTERVHHDADAGLREHSQVQAP